MVEEKPKKRTQNKEYFILRNKQKEAQRNSTFFSNKKRNEKIYIILIDDEIKILYINNMVVYRSSLGDYIIQKKIFDLFM